MSHDHDHDDGQHHATRAGVSRRREAKLRVAMWLNIVIVAAQVVFGFIAHSLGLLADAGHNLTDVAAVGASLVALRLARRPANRQRSFGYHRATVIAAQANATSILVVTALVTYEAIRRLLNPTPVNGSIVIAVALGAAACNLAAVLVLRDSHAGHGHGEDLNMRSAILQLAGDTAASLGVAGTGVVIAATGGWYWLDPAISIAIGLLIAIQAWKLLRQTLDVLLLVGALPDGRRPWLQLSESVQLAARGAHASIPAHPLDPQRPDDDEQLDGRDGPPERTQPRPRPGLTCDFLERTTRFELATLTLAKAMVVVAKVMPTPPSRLFSAGSSAQSAESAALRPSWFNASNLCEWAPR